jgi:hypothetical protein
MMEPLAMFHAAVALTGLQPLVSDIEKRVSAGAAAETMSRRAPLA